MILRRRLGMGIKGFGECYDVLLRCRCGLVQGLWPMLDWAIFPLSDRLPKDWTREWRITRYEKTSSQQLLFQGGKDETKGKRTQES